jgi:hypothetical protein
MQQARFKSPRQPFPSDELLDETIRVWQPSYRQPLTREDAREIIYSVTSYVRMLMRWRQGKAQTEKLS